MPGRVLNRPPRAERVFAAIALLILADGFDLVLNAILPPQLAAGLPPGRLLLAPVAAVPAFLLARDSRQLGSLLRASWPILVLVVLAFVSSLWSIAPGQTLRWSTGLAGASLFGLYLGQRFSIEAQVRVLAWAIGIIAVASGLVALSTPWLHPVVALPSRAGILMHANILGRLMALGVIVFSLLVAPARLFACIGLFLCAALLLYAGTRTGMIALAVGAGVFWASSRGRRIAWSLVAAALLAVPAIVFFVRHAESPLSNRSVIWTVVWQAVQLRPLLGYGYGAFWYELNARPGATPERIGWWVGHAHNGYLDLTLDLGLIGLLVFSAPFVLHAVRAWNLARSRPPHPRTRADLWPVLFLAFLAVTNLAESVLVGHKIFWVLYAAVVVGLAGSRRDEADRWGRSFGP